MRREGQDNRKKYSCWQWGKKYKNKGRRKCLTPDLMVVEKEGNDKNVGDDCDFYWSIQEREWDSNTKQDERTRLRKRQQVLVHDFMMTTLNNAFLRDVSCLVRQRKKRDCSLERVWYSFSIEGERERERENRQYFYASEVSFLLCVCLPPFFFICVVSLDTTNKWQLKQGKK